MDVRPTFRVLQGAQFVASIGDGAYLTTSALFFALVVGLPEWQVALGLTLAWGIGFGASLPLGALADRLGVRTTMVAFAAATGVVVACYPLVRGPFAFVVVATLYAVGQSALGAVRQAAIAAVIPAAHRSAARARIQVLQNVGLGAGASLGGIALLVGTPDAFVVVLLLDAACFLVASALAIALPRVDRGRQAPGRTLRRALRDRRYLVPAGLNAVLLLYMPLLSVVLPLWVVSTTTAPPAVSALAFLLNTIGVAALQAHASRRVGGVQEALRAVRLGGALLGAACLLVGAAALPEAPVAAAAIVIAAVAVQTIGEVVFAAGSWTIGFALAPEDAQGGYQAVWAAGVPVARAAGPVLLAGTMLAVGPLGWIGAAALFAGAGLGMTVAVRDQSAAASA